MRIGLVRSRNVKYVKWHVETMDRGSSICGYISGYYKPIQKIGDEHEVDCLVCLDLRDWGGWNRAWAPYSEVEKLREQIIAADSVSPPA